MTQLGSIEAGGTKFIVARGDEQGHIKEIQRIKTTDPGKTISECVLFFQKHPVAALSIGSFGPLDLDKQSETYGHIMNTPKKGWKNCNLLGRVQSSLHIPLFLTTDVNASAYGEYAHGIAKIDHSVLYFTFGTGIGGGAVQDGHFIGGMGHPEMGHSLIVPRSDDDFPGICPYHGNHCFEGMASGPAIQRRTGIPGENLPPNDPVFDLIAFYAAQLAYTAYVHLIPKHIVFGGSVINPTRLLVIRSYFSRLNNGYLGIKNLNDLIQLTSFKNNLAATVGNLALANQLLLN